ncbi:hypothetical protein ACFVVX_29555 [Kitasatospora sp. NPDC058170]|uniref:hypothetical protein n=1 Tax=Kitasatospora sp. NPDC058170 TaxID=3346364 RepID=UPI0036D8032E
MNRSTLNRPAGVVAVLTLLAAALGLAGPAAADPLPLGRCTTSSGVVLAVDLAKWGGPLLRSCGTTPTTGYTLLNQGGWRTAGTGHDGPAFICRIGYSGYQGGKQFPPPEQEKCVLTPPATAYWSYWHADPGENTWSYSQLGAMSYHPKPGSVDLWIFGATNIEGTEGRPAYSPDTVRALNAEPVGEGTGGTGTAGTTGSSGSTGSAGTSGTTGTSGSTGSTGTTGSTGSAGSTGTAGTTGSGSAGATGAGQGTAAGGSTGGGTAGSGAAAGGGGSATGGAGSGGTGRKPAPSTAARTTPPPATGAAPETTATEPPPADPSPEQPPAPTADPAAAVTPTDTPAATPETTPPTATPSPSGTSRVVDAEPVADAPHDTGSIAPGLVAVAIVLGLGLATLLAARRRRRQAD